MTFSISVRVRRLAVVIALALTVVGLGASTASAGQSQDISTKRGAVWFNHNGDRLYAIDTKVDGKGIQALITWAGRSESVLDGGASGPPKSDNLDLPEGTIIELQMCYFTHSGLDKCSKPQTAIV
jgi:hypothetical protein